MYEMTPDRFFSHGRYCGVSLGDVTSGGPILYVRFYSDDYGVGAGFVANFSHINGNNNQLTLIGERGGSVVECRTPEREVGGSIPTAAVLCP